MADVTKQDVIDFIANMTVLELSEMVKELEEKFGVSAAAPVAMMAAGPGGEAGGAAEAPHHAAIAGQLPGEAGGRGDPGPRQPFLNQGKKLLLVHSDAFCLRWILMATRSAGVTPGMRLAMP